MKNTTNYSLLLPDEDDFYSVNDMNTNMGVIDARMKSNQNIAEAVTKNYDAHASNKSNPHGVTKAQVGLSNVPNVTTNNQAPTYTETSTLSALASGEVLSVAFGKLAKAISSLISHLSNASNPHGVTKAQVGLGSADNTSDINKPISTATQTALDTKVDKVTGKVLSTNDYTTAEKTKLAGIATGAQVNTITGVKGNAETAYRTGQVNITPANIGISVVNNTADSAKSVLSATKLTTSRSITLTGDVSGSVGFDGTMNVSMTTTVADDSHNHIISNVDGLQTALDAKQATISGGASSITSSNLTANRALVSNGSGKVAASEITSTELGYLDGVSNNIQTQINSVVAKLETDKNNLQSQINDIEDIFDGYRSVGQLGSPALVSRVTDLNDYVTDGIYTFGQDYTPTNTPSGVVNGWLIVCSWSNSSNNTVKQIWLRQGTLESNDFMIYVRTKITGTWGKWAEILTNKSGYNFNLAENIISANSDLNNFKTIGTYRATGTNVATSIANSPTTYNFRLTVEYISSNNYIMQTVVDRDGVTYRRACDISASKWTSWNQL